MTHADRILAQLKAIEEDEDLPEDIRERAREDREALEEGEDE